MQSTLEKLNKISTFYSRFLYNTYTHCTLYQTRNIKPKSTTFPIVFLKNEILKSVVGPSEATTAEHSIRECRQESCSSDIYTVLVRHMN